MSESRSGSRRTTWLLAITAISAVMVFLVVALLMSIFERKQEARNPYVRLVEVNEETTDPARVGRELGARVRRLQAHRRSLRGHDSADPKRCPAEKAKAIPG